ncbi:hypothetical protein ACIQI8_12930 [Streptomyces sp. NPDC092369]|uniref:hypothetical protein n=1 Tax=Streptomyces sp. NPDC092369 TaxID=3366015 RepID=UPI00381EF10F
MRGVGAVLSAAVTAVVVVGLAGCGGGGDGSGGSESHASAVDAGARTVTVSAVQGDVRAALRAGGFGRPAFADERSAALRRHPCQVAARVRTHTVPDRKAAERVVAELKDRGWTAEEPLADESGIAWALDRDGWTLSVVSGEAYPQEMWAALPPAEAGDGFKGVAVFGFGRCDLGTATPTP